MPPDPFDGDKSLAEVFFASVRVAKGLIEKSAQTIVPFALALSGERMIMKSFPLPPNEVVDFATNICRSPEINTWALTWEGSVDVGHGNEQALCFRVAPNGKEKFLTLFWRYTRNPAFKLIGNPGILEN